MPRAEVRRGHSPFARRLADELRRLQGLGLGTALERVMWMPRRHADIDAEVVNGTVYIYVAEPAAAMRTLRHEVLHFEIAQCSLPYVEVLNHVLSDVNREAYRRKERLVERLLDLLSP